MSRDFTPLQYYLLSEHHKKDGLDAFEVMESTCYVLNGEQIYLHSKEEMDLRRQFPLFGYLINSFLKVHDELSKIPGGLDHLKKREEELSAYIQTGVGDENSPLIKWFKGELDEHFYYSEYNEELFVDSLMEDARSASKASLDSLISEASTRANETSDSKGFYKDSNEPSR